MYKSLFMVAGAVVLMLSLSMRFSGRKIEVDKVKASPAPCNCSGFNTVSLNGQIPHDAPLISSQQDANCFAWSEFISLNWSMDSTVGFGDPFDMSPVQWETYMSADRLMTPNGTPPPPWNSSNTRLKGFINARARVLMHATKFDENVSGFVVNESGQAFPNNAPSWLGAQNGTNLWYEVVVNKDEYDYIVANKFYNANNQQSWVEQGNRISLPQGNASSDTVGAIEIKVAWMEVPDPTNQKWGRYKLSKALLIDEETDSTRMGVVAMIGMHILHKTVTQSTWTWATFEHVDNAPVQGKTTAGMYNLYNSNCKSTSVTVTADCSKDDKDSTYVIGCTPNVPPPYYLCAGGPKPVPIQIVRQTPIDQDAVAINNKIQQYIKKNYPNSVFQYYQLVNIMWSQAPAQKQPITVPQTVNMLPLTPVANTTMETYIQKSQCTDCHKSATIAPTANTPKQVFASDFSFVFVKAGYPKNK